MKDLTDKDILNLYAKIAKSITSSLDYSTIIKKIMDQVHLIFQPQHWSLLGLDEKNDELYFIICEGDCADKIKKLRLKIGEGVAGQVAKTGIPLVIRNATESNQVSRKMDQISGFITTSLIAVPIIFQEKILGVIELINFIDDGFSENKLELLKTIADFSAIAIQNSIDHERILFLATHDALTKVYNRAYLDGLHTSFSNETDESNYGVIALLDIDKFKDINDNFGHSFGDSVLIKMAEILLSSCRKSDYVFRIGGDEFMVFITDIAPHKAEYVSREMATKLTLLKDQNLDFSFSFGISYGKIKELDQIIHLADLRMYEDKHKKSF